MAHAEDMTAYLNSNGYFPSFNRPYFPTTREASGHTKAEGSHGDLYSWSENARARRFKSEVHNVNAAGGMRMAMTQNLYPKAGSTSPGHEISARMDLLSVDAMPNGGIDAKVTGRCLQKLLSVQAISSPSHQFLPPFRWQFTDGAKKSMEVWPGFPHVGMPNIWNFDFVQISPNGAGPLEEGLANNC